jgi:hypothetical protein
MGMVFKARDRVLDETVALKVLRTDIAATPDLARRFRQEIKLARKVRHKNVCGIHEYGEDGALRFIAMDLVDGVDLRRVLQRQGPLPPLEACEVGLRVAEGLAAIHDEGIVHRDLKTANIMVDPHGSIRLMDFGIAKATGDGATGVTATGMIIGTPEYMSPEQARGMAVDSRSDIYALGIILYEILTGDVPFRGDTPITTILKQIQEPPPLQGPDAVRIPQPLRPVLAKALEKDPEARFATARELIGALNGAMAALATPSAATPGAGPGMPPDAIDGAGSPRQARRATTALAWVVTGATIGLAAVAIVVAVVASRSFRAPAATTAPVTAAPTTSRADPATSDPARSHPGLAPIPSATATSQNPQGAMPPTVSSRPERRIEVAARPAAPAVAAPTGSLRIVAVPWADVTVDGLAVEAGPLRRIPLAAGAHVVRLLHPDYQPLQRKVTIKAGETLTLSVDLAEDAVPKKR